MINHVKTGVFLLVITAMGGIVCQGQVLAPQLENFDRVHTTLPAGWRIVSGDWSVADGAMLADSMNSDAQITFGETSWQDYEVEVTVTFRKIRNPSRWVSVLVRATPDGTAPWSQVPLRFDATQPNGVEFAVRTPDGWSVRKKAAAKSACQLNRPRQLKVIVRRTHIEGYLDGERVVSSELCVDRATGCVGLGVSGCVATFDNFHLRHLPTTTSPPFVHNKTCDVVAHRGFSAIAPENTLAAIREAIRAGATGCEFDVYGCLDGPIVLMHDKTVDRTTNGTGLVTNMSLQELQQLDAGSWKNAKYSNERIPTLAQALQLLKDTPCQPVIEIKMEGIAERVVNTVRELEMIDQVAVIAFSQTVVREIREIEPKLTCAWLCSETLHGTPTEQADWLQTRADQCQAKLVDVNFNMLSPELITELKQRGIGVWTWTVNEAAVTHALRDWGVDSITTDYPDRLNPKSR